MSIHKETHQNQIYMFKYQSIISTLFIFLTFFNFGNAQTSVTWNVDNVNHIGGFTTTIYGEPKAIEIDNIKAIEFDGINDGLLINNNPLSEATNFTVEIIFMPYPGGLEEQRFLHLQQDDNNRMLIELRSTNTNQWFLDTFIKSAGSGVTLYADAYTHSTEDWHHAALIYQSNTMSHYVDGQLELSGEIAYQKMTTGKVSLGVRQNKVSWYKGAIRLVKFTHKALTPDEFFRLDTISSGVKSINPLLNTNRSFTINGFYQPNNTKKGILDLSLKEQGALSISLISISGQKLTLYKKAFCEKGVFKQQVDLSQLNSGIYIIQIQLNENSEQIKITI